MQRRLLATIVMVAGLGFAVVAGLLIAAPAPSQEAPTEPDSGVAGDLDGDGDVDRDDLDIILAARGEEANGPDDPRDLDGDGQITALDARKLTNLCSHARCEVWTSAVEPQSETTVAVPQQWEFSTTVEGAVLTSPQTDSVIDQLGSDAVHVPSDIGIRVLNKQPAETLSAFTERFASGYYPTYASSSLLEIQGHSALLFDDHGSTFSRQPVLALFVEVDDSEVLLVSLNRHTATPGERQTFLDVIDSLSF